MFRCFDSGSEVMLVCLPDGGKLSRLRNRFIHGGFEKINNLGCKQKCNLEIFVTLSGLIIRKEFQRYDFECISGLKKIQNTHLAK